MRFDRFFTPTGGVAWSDNRLRFSRALESDSGTPEAGRGAGCVRSDAVMIQKREDETGPTGGIFGDSLLEVN